MLYAQNSNSIWGSKDESLIRNRSSYSLPSTCDSSAGGSTPVGAGPFGERSDGEGPFGLRSDEAEPFGGMGRLSGGESFGLEGRCEGAGAFGSAIFGDAINKVNMQNI